MRAEIKQLSERIPLHRSPDPREPVDPVRESFRRPRNVKAGKFVTPAFTFRQYVEDKFLPECRRVWKEPCPRYLAGTRSFGRPR
jgi:hypothetical protein